MVRNFV
jgi:hypothetical protein